MPEQLLPDTVAATIADLHRRVEILERTSRLGLNRLRHCRATGSAVPTTFGTFETGTVGNTWEDDLGGSGTGYPKISMNASKKMLFLLGYRPINVANSAGARCKSVQVALRMTVDGGGGPVSGFINRQFANQNANQVDTPLMAARVIDNFAVGVGYEFQLEAAWTDDVPAAPVSPQLSDAFLIVLPLTV